MAVRDIDAAVEQTPAGLPQARVDAGGTNVEVYQDQSGGLAVAIAATAADEAASLSPSTVASSIPPPGASHDGPAPNLPPRTPRPALRDCGARHVPHGDGGGGCGTAHPRQRPGAARCGRGRRAP